MSSCVTEVDAIAKQTYSGVAYILEFDFRFLNSSLIRVGNITIRAFGGVCYQWLLPFAPLQNNHRRACPEIRLLKMNCY
jgi:hypothetical protein